MTLAPLVQGQLNIVSTCEAITPDSRHFLATRELSTQARWYQHWPHIDCGERLHAKAAVDLCRRVISEPYPTQLVYDSLHPAARGATPLLQSLISQCPGFIEIWGVCSGQFDPHYAGSLANTLLQPGQRLLYLYDPLQRLSGDPTPQLATLHYLIFSAQA
ncbi:MULTISPECIES: hypothetical protein [Pseudomonas]|uniref:Uncharacterized protein n=1 Tax=Pseudomonas tritici TaxID=2745518 RepID=A0A8H9YYD3_9PSED|nr:MULTISPECIES: hypothetical protein [Pseudomonas]MBP2870932.1 hypothetical protein [Pseudomonas sp. SWRI144]MBW8128756.1 hypothetical protein [Pseudomonas sp. LAP_36]MBW8137688.1 hypothetical protein [Pseudomonas sp. PAMC 26818]QXH82322.1 hypothetical protein HU722_0020335 [Pseudomonas tritici]CRL98593.1 hypothetical protein [Pseudomonas sp. 24 R 17]